MKKLPPIPTPKENPDGLHGRYRIQKVNGLVSPGAEYFVLRLDNGGSDKKHIKAGLQGIAAYAGAIENHIPKLAQDLRERYLQKNKRKAILRHATGKKAKQFRFVLVGDNGEIVGGSCTETYINKRDAIKTLVEYYPAFQIVDRTDVSPRIKDSAIAKAEIQGKK